MYKNMIGISSVPSAVTVLEFNPSREVSGTMLVPTSVPMLVAPDGGMPGPERLDAMKLAKQDEMMLKVGRTSGKTSVASEC